MHPWQHYLDLLKRLKTKPTLSTITLGILNTKKNSFKTKHHKRVKILFDTGCDATLIHHSLAENYPYKQTDRPTGTPKQAVLGLQRPVNSTLHFQLSMRTETSSGQLLWLSSPADMT